MAISYMDYTSPYVQFTYDLSDNLFFKKNDRNYINALSIKQLNTLGNVSLLDIYLSTGNIVEPHYHQNASELVYCVSGAAVVSLINPFTQELLNFPIRPGQVANVPQAWWHYEIATVDNTHLLAVFDAPIPEFIGGSDLLRLTPAEVLAHSYCLDEAKVKETLAPITRTVFIGPPHDCKKYQARHQAADHTAHIDQSHGHPAYGYSYQHPQKYDFPQQQPVIIGNGRAFANSNGIG
ncbi:cupin domain-containing protein [Paenibacillus thermoaerophilus]|uniref:Cupin domain-containing protein n=1 Tax=Paenibacillus thermoaerophilus TaxID=1215385 RepID=A0ABW2V4Z7_9BACL|nr:cupin domain-containing protein [Paenibacillus thermoaerophilus]TMV17969.1 cupin domain-containing protein [Paenibacillus thermoaerophilus]